MDGETLFGIVWVVGVLLGLAVGLVWLGYKNFEFGGGETALLCILSFAWPIVLAGLVICGPIFGLGWLLHRLGQGFRSSS